MLRFLTKAVIAAAAIYLLGFFPALLSYANIYQPLIIGAVLGFVGIIMEELTLSKYDVRISTIMDFFAAGTFVLFMARILNGFTVTMAGILAVAVLVAITEYFFHLHLIKENNEEVS